MTDTNTVNVIGRLTKDVAVHTFDNGGSILTLSIAVNTSKKDGDKWVDEANFFNCKYNVKKSDKLIELLKKGVQVAVTGHLRQERWEKDGQKNSQVVIVVEHLQFTTNGSKSDNASAGDNGGFQEDLPYDDGPCPF